jgi:hypothetical protein
MRRSLLLILTASALLLGILALAGCSSSSPPVPPSPSGPSKASDTTASGRVVDGKTGRPYPGVIVEFENLNNGNVHTQTNRDGEYSIELPVDVYTALALTDDNNIGFTVVSGDNSISVPPSARVDFESYEIVPGFNG